MLDLLVVSQSCLTAINRTPYRTMMARGWSVEIVVPAQYSTTGFARAADPARPGDPPLHQLPMQGSHPRLWMYEGLRELIAQKQPRIALLDVDPGSRLALQVGRWMRRHGGRTACISCDNLLRSVASEIRRAPGAGARLAASRVLMALSRPRIDHVFISSRDSRTLMERLGLGDRLSYMPFGFDPALFRPDDAARARVRRELGLRHDTIAYFGRLSPEKGIHVLLRALADLGDRPWQLMLDEFREYRHPYAERLRGMIDELALHDRIVFFDASHDEIADYMNAADVVVLPSVSSPTWKEQYGRVAPEAMACGRAVIVSDCGSLPEVVGDAAVVVPENDADALGRAIVRLLDDPGLRADYGRRAREHALAHHSMLVQCDRFEAQFSRWAEPSRRDAARAQAAGVAGA